MAFEPVCLYSYRMDVPGLIPVLRCVATEVHVDGPEDNWRTLTAYGPKRRLRRRAKLIVRHDSNHCRGRNWKRHIREMYGYFNGFPDVHCKAELLLAIQSFRFSLSMADAELNLEGEERLPWVLAICRHLDGIIFTPSTLFDSQGRILISAYGNDDDKARVPQLPPLQELADIVFEFDGPEEDEDSDDDDSEDTDSENNAEPEEGPCEPPSADRVVRRAMVLAAVANRGMIENEVDTFADPEKSRLQQLDWLEDLDVLDEIEPCEMKILKRPVGRLDIQSMVNAVWRLEGLGVLCWALRRYELPPYDALVNPNDLWNATEIYDTDAALEVIRQASLRPAEKLAAYHKHATMTHWRFRNYRLRPVAVDFVAMSRDCWIGSFDLTPFRILKKDLAVGGVPITRADPELLNTCHSAASERHQAINWLTGWNSPRYSRTDTST